MEQVRDAVGDEGLFAQQLVEIDKSSVFYWLMMWAKEEQQKTFRTVLTDIHDSQVKGWQWQGKRELRTCISLRVAMTGEAGVANVCFLCPGPVLPCSDSLPAVASG